MHRYDPDRTPDPEAWVAPDEQERVALIAAHLRRARVQLPNLRLHATIHAIVENQLAERVAVVQETLERLLRDGLSRHEAIHAVGSVVTEHLWNAMHGT